MNANNAEKTFIQRLVHRTRSYRRFDEGHEIDTDILRFLVDLGRLSASAANRQPLKYILSNRSETNDIIFPKLKWAAYLKDWSGPDRGERPSAYILVLGDKRITGEFGCDHGIATQNILLGAVSLGLGGCIVGSIDRAGLMEAFRLPDHFRILHVIALGKPVEKVVIETVGPDGGIRYWRDEEGTHHVPKRPLEEVIVPIK